MGSQRSFLAALMVSVVLGVFTEAFAQSAPQQPFLKIVHEELVLIDEVVVQFTADLSEERITVIHRTVRVTKVLLIVPVYEGVHHVVTVPAGKNPGDVAAHYKTFKGVTTAKVRAVYRPQRPAH